MNSLVFLSASLTGGGAERAINQVTKILESDYSVSLICINESQVDLAQPCEDVIFLNRKHNSQFFNTLVSYLKFVRVILQKRPEFLVLNCDLPELFGALSPFGPKIIFLEHSNFPWTKRQTLGKLVRAILNLRRAKCVAVSDHIKIWPLSISPICVIQNPVSVSNHELVKPSTVFLKRIVFIGRFANPEKRPEIIYELCKVTNLPGLMIGDGREREPIMKLAHDFDVLIDFPGQIIDPWTLVNPGDLLVVPSLFEGDGLVVIEAILNRVPILLSDIPEFRRFGLPSTCYCSNIEEFQSRIDSLKNRKNRLEDLCAPEELRNSLEEERSIVRIGREWNKFLRAF
jgi:hypothetical protein